MLYYHTYMPEIWDGIVKNGFINKNSGVRLNLNWRLEGTRDFNLIAKKDSVLYNIVKDGNLGFYVDRLQGGVEYFDYTPDPELCQLYDELAGDRFLGFQMHEWASNYLGEFTKMYNAKLTEWSEQAIIDAYKRLYPENEALMTESMSAKELFELLPPSNLYHLYKNIDYLFDSRSKKTGGRLITCDSFALGFDYEFKHGARNIMPEIGGQIEDARLQLAYARGVAKAYDKPFGAYYEPWGSKPLSAVRYTADDRSEWQPEGNIVFPYSQGNENSGSTRSLQRRLHFYSYFAGADFMSEEWCSNTTFYDWNDFELSPYGKVKKEFIDFTQNFDVGKPLTPVAAVLPEDMRFIHTIHSTDDFYMNMPLYRDSANQMRTIRRGLCKLFSNSCEMQGNEYKQRCGKDVYILINSPLPDAIDIIHKDSKTIGNYALTVDLTKEVDENEVIEALKQNLPVYVNGNVSWTVTDKRYLLIINNDGVYFDTKNGEYADGARDHTAKITFKQPSQPSLVYGDGKLNAQNGEYYIDIPAGRLAVIKF